MTIVLFAADVERIDTWVFRIGLAIPVVCLVWLLLWHLLPYLSGKMAKKREPARLSPEPLRPPSAIGIQADPEKLERTCAALEESLAEKYLELANSWFGAGRPEKATAVLQKIVRHCPETRQAKVAKERLERMTAGEHHT
jgi:hypothetical protein